MLTQRTQILWWMDASSPLNKLKVILKASVVCLLISTATLSACTPYMHRRPATRNECVILLHGLCRSSISMMMIKHHLEHNGYAIVNVDYASTQKPIEAAANEDVVTAVARCKRQNYARIHFVTHSLGAIVVRSYLQNHRLPEGSRIVMLAPPNQGSELADWAQKTFPRLIRLVPPVVNQLGTNSRTRLSRLAPVKPEVGVIIGNQSWNPFFSKILPGPDDGKVTVERAKLKEMRDFLVAPCNHTTILLNKEIRNQVFHFLESGRFERNSCSHRKPCKMVICNINY